MELEKAKDQLAEIHRHLVRTEVYRGYRSRFVAASGALAFLGAWLQPAPPEAGPFKTFVLYWCALAAVSVALVGANLTWDFLRSGNSDRRKTLGAVGQFLPCLVAGFLVTWVAYFRSPELMPYLPGLWAVLFSLGIFSSAPHLPASTPYMGGFYLAAGLVLLSLAPDGESLGRWGMGLTFGLGQLLGAWILLEPGEGGSHGTKGH